MSTDSWKTKYYEDGYAVIEDWMSHQDCDELRSECSRIIDNLDVENEHRTIFTTKNNDTQRTDDYFITSGDKIRYFFEKDAFDGKGALLVKKHDSLNKIGHALHWWNPVFKKHSLSDKVKTVLNGLGLVKPAMIQSMYIFKNGRIGGEVGQHQDTSFLQTDPMKLYGAWIALEDATLDNGCLWFYPGSHKPGKLFGDRRMCRTMEGGNVVLEMQGAQPDEDKKLFKPCPVKKGSLVLIHGMVLHWSAPNTSENSRHAYAFHVIDQHESVWSDKNWLQPTEQLPFTPVYETQPE